MATIFAMIILISTKLHAWQKFILQKEAKKAPQVYNIKKKNDGPERHLVEDEFVGFIDHEDVVDDSYHGYVTSLTELYYLWLLVFATLITNLDTKWQHPY
jgi:hypothetical protein